MATPAQRTNTWILNEWYDQAVAGTTGGYTASAELFSWGRQSPASGYNNGRLGQNNLTNYSSPTQIGTYNNWTYLAFPGGQNSSMGAVNKDGELWMWGNNFSGNLGHNNQAPQYTFSSPVQVGGTTWKYVAAGAQNGIAVKTDGTLWSWGYGDDGALGLNQNGSPGPFPGSRRSSPVQIGTDTDWSSSRPHHVTSGQRGNGCIKTDGTFWVWGKGHNGQLAKNSNNNVSSPTQIPGTTWSAVQIKQYKGMALKSDNTLWAWGDQAWGDLGINNRTAYSSPMQIPGSWSTNDYTLAQTGYQAGCVKTDGTLWVWGQNTYGSLGQNDNTARSSPVQVGSGTDWSQIFDLGGVSFAGIKSDGTAWVWGQNSYGPLGQNNITQYSSPVQLPGNWNQLGSGNEQSAFGVTLN